MASQCSRKRKTIAWLTPIAVHAAVVIVCLLARSPGEPLGFCGAAYHDELFTATVFAGPLFSAPAALTVIELAAEEPSIEAAIVGAVLLIMSMPVVIWSIVLFSYLIQGKIRNMRTFLWQFTVLHCYGMTLSMMMTSVVAIAMV